MKLDSISVKDYPPIHTFDVSGLSNTVVMAGPNGVGKTRLMSLLIQGLRSPGTLPNARMVISATNESERNEWGSSTLDTANGPQTQALRRTLQRNQKRGNWRSSVFHIDSSREITQVQPFQWSWNFVDPVSEMIGWDLLFNPFANRFQDSIHAIYRMLGHHRSEISKRAIELQKAGEIAMTLDFPDPLEKYRKAFQLLLAPKTLADIDITNPQIRYNLDGQVLPIESLSSGEREAFRIVFDLLLREPEDCIVFFDEPELHLHPELSFRMLKTLQTVGARNQFIFLTHSADIISGSIENSVIFIAPRPKGENQAINLKVSDESVSALRELGQSLGVISLGRKIVLIEGNDSSIDRDTYGTITQGLFPDLVLAPSGSRQTIVSFSRVVEDVLDKTVWGIDFFMLADRDNSLPDSTLTDLESKSKGRLRFLPRLHIENYFLDEQTIASSYEDLVSASDWRRNPSLIRECLLELCRACIPLAVNCSLSTQLSTLIGEIDLSLRNPPSKLDDFVVAVNRKISDEYKRVSGHLDQGPVEILVRGRWQQLESSLTNESWKTLFPGKVIFGQFAGQAGLKTGYLRNLYIAAARKSQFVVFQDVLQIFKQWSSV